MTAYTANLTITANTAWSTWYEFSDRACNDTATVYRWYVATFFSEAASRRYQWIGEMLGCIIALAVLYVQRWAEAEGQSCLPADHFPGVGNMVEADPFSPAVNPAYAAVAATIAESVATLVVPVSRSVEKMTLAQLRKMAIAHNRGLAKDDPRRIANAARLTKAQALAVLG